MQYITNERLLTYVELRLDILVMFWVIMIFLMHVVHHVVSRIHYDSSNTSIVVKKYKWGTLIYAPLHVNNNVILFCVSNSFMLFGHIQIC